MSVQFRKRGPEEILAIIKKRIWHIILPTIAVALAVAWVVQGLPEIFRSTTFLVLTPAAISEKVAPSLTNEDLSQRMDSISQTVLSRSSLEGMIAKYALYPKEQTSGVPMEQIVNSMRSSILVEQERSDDKVHGVRISYKNTVPETAQRVTAMIADEFIKAQAAESTQSAETTKEFIDSQLAQSKSTLDALEAQRLQIMTSNVEALPESSQGLIAQLNGLRSREGTISKDKEGLMTEKGRLLESVRAYNSQIRLIENFGERETQEAVTQAARVEDTPAYGQLIQKRAEFSAKLENLTKQYRAKHPLVIEAQTEIDKINDELNKLSKNTEQRVKQANQSVTRKAELQKQSLEIEKQKAEGQITQIDLQMQMKDREIEQNNLQIAALEAKINTIPNVKVALEGINNQYQSAKTNYDELMKKFNNAQQQVQRETNSQGESIRIVDPANLPQTSENASKKPMFIGMGLAGGLFIGLLFAAFYEVPRLMRLQTIKDVEHYTGIPVLTAIPSLLDEQEKKSLHTRHLLRLSAAIAIAIVSVPVLIIVLQLSKVFERLT